MGKALRVIALGLVLVVVLAAITGGSVLWYVSRSLPMTRGNLELPELQAPVKVYRDAWGVPHIYAANEHDLFLAQGFITAQDRLFQMDLTRRLAAGRLSEVLGPEHLDSDRFFRTLGLRRTAEASVPLYTGAARTAAEAYTAGVNAYIDQAKRHGLLPWEFTLLRYKPEPWTLADSISITKYMAYDLSGHWAGQLFRYQLVEKVGQKRALELFPNYPADAATILSPPPSTLGLDDREVDRLLAFAPDSRLGSNSWVVSGNRTATGKPFLANDPHLTLQTPSVWYEVHLAAPRPYNVIGVNYPGVPGVLLGHNARIAWGATSLPADVQDLYVEQPNPSDPKKFRFKENWEDARVLRETIKVRGAAAQNLEVLITRHGPVISPLVTLNDPASKTMLSLRWTGLEPSAELEGILALNRAGDWDEFKAALARFDSPAYNWLYADVVGNIGYRASGKIPIRKADNAFLPLPGWTGEDEWQGLIPTAELPETYNPKAGYIATANNKVVGEDYKYNLTQEWAAPWRASRLVEQLHEARVVSQRAMVALQTDLTDVEARRYAAILLDACRQATGGKWSDLEADARTVVGEWDYVARADSPGAAIWNEWRVQLLQAIYQPSMGPVLFRRFLDAGSSELAFANLMETYLQGNPNAWLDPGKDSLRSLPRLAQDSFQRAAEIVAAKQTADMDGWRWGAAHRASFAHPLSHLPYLDRLLQPRSLPVGGDTVTVNATNYRLTAPFQVSSAATWRQVVDLADLSRSVDVLAPGEGSHVLSPYYLNQMQPWTDGTYHLQVFKEEDLKTSDLLNLLPVSTVT